jgi:hypothetical protein
MQAVKEMTSAEREYYIGRFTKEIEKEKEAIENSRSK